jgi:hypothetical protein
MASEDSRERIARLTSDLAGLPEDRRRAAMDALAREDYVAVRALAAAKQAHYEDQMELTNAALARLGLTAAMCGFALVHPDRTPEQLARTFLEDGATTALLANEFDAIRRENHDHG